MKGSRFRKLKAIALISARSAWRKRDFALRVAIAWLIAFCFFQFDRQDEIDMRLSLRGPQARSADIALVQVHPEEWLRLKGSLVQFPKFTRHPKLPDNFFWNSFLWDKLVGNILAEDPKGIIVAMNFSSKKVRSYRNFRDPKVHWLSRKVVAGEADLDRVFRRVNPTFDSKTHITNVAAKIYSDLKLPELQDIKLINYRGPRGSFDTYSFSDIINGKVAGSKLKNKLIIIGPHSVADHEFITPLGDMSRSEIYANTIDNYMHNRWVKTSQTLPFAILLLVLALVTAWITMQYPQMLALVILGFFQIGLIAVSLSVFDIFYYLMPMAPQIVAVAASFMIFMSYQLTLTDYERDQLEKEKQFMIDVEELKHNFLSLISHDLKTPIAKIQGITDRILSRKVDDNTSNDVISLKAEAEHLNRYIKTLLQVTRAESHGFQLNPDSMDINEVIEKVCEELSTLAQAKEVQLKLDLEPMFLIEADQLLMHEVILNLVENAIKFSPEAGVIKISSQDVDGQVIVMVEDDGPGIQDSEVDQIFEKFYQGEKGKSYSKGSGLGLYLVKYFIERHKGKVIVNSGPKKGMKIGFSLPTHSEPESLEGENYHEANA